MIIVPRNPRVHCVNAGVSFIYKSVGSRTVSGFQNADSPLSLARHLPHWPLWPSGGLPVLSLLPSEYSQKLCTVLIVQIDDG